MTKIHLPDPIHIPLEKLKLDENNPNEMSDEMYEGLGKSLEQFGLYDTILVGKPDKNGMYTVRNGNHRIQKLQDSTLDGKTKIWAFPFTGKEVDLILLRQSLNKTHGQHDPEKDILEYSLIEKYNKMNLLSQLLAQPQEQLVIPPREEINVDTDPTGHYEDTFLHGNVKQLYFVFSNEQFQEVMPRIDKIMKKNNLDNHTDMFLLLLKSYEKNNSKKKT